MKKTTVGDRLKEVIESKGMNIKMVEKALGLNSTIYYAVKRGNVDSGLIENIQSVVQMSKEDILYIHTGERSNILKQPPPDDPIQSMTRWMQRIERRLDDLERQSKKDNT